MKIKGKCTCICSTCTPLTVVNAEGKEVATYRYCCIKNRTLAYPHILRTLKDGQRIVFDCPDREME